MRFEEVTKEKKKTRDSSGSLQNELRGPAPNEKGGNLAPEVERRKGERKSRKPSTRTTGNWHDGKLTKMPPFNRK